LAAENNCNFSASGWNPTTLKYKIVVYKKMEECVNGTQMARLKLKNRKKSKS